MTTARQERAIASLSQHHPLVLSDLRHWLTLPGAEEVSPLHTVTKNTVVPKKGVHYLLGCNAPAVDLEYRRNIGPDLTLVRVFDTVQLLLEFLDGEHVETVLADPQWRPWFMMPAHQSRAIPAFLAGHNTEDWPWELTELAKKGKLRAGLAEQHNAYIVDAIEKRAAEQSRRLEQLYADAPTPGQVLAAGQRPLRIMTAIPQMSVYQRFCGRDMHEACLESGFDSVVFEIKSQITINLELLEAIEAHRPDIFFVISKHRKHFPDLPKRLTFVMWDQDFLCAPDPDLNQHVGPHDYLLTLMKEWGHHAVFNGMRSESVKHLSLGFNPQVFYGPTEPVKMDHEVLFIGNIHPFEAYRKMIFFDNWSDECRRVMLHARDRLFSWVRSRSDSEPYVIPEPMGFLLESAKETGMDLESDTGQWRKMAWYFQYRVAHYVVRECFIESLVDYDLGLYGHGWDKFPKLAPYARPAIENGAPMLDVMHRSAIHLQLHTWTVHHPRLYDTAGARGFLLVGRVPEDYTVDRAFTPGEELDTFGSITEMHQKIRHYLDHPEQRDAMAQRAGARSDVEHTMSRRVQTMIRSLCTDAA